MNKSILPYLKPMIAHELQRMQPIIQAHKRLLQLSTDANIDIDSYIDVAARIIYDALGKENVNISIVVLRAEISQEYNTPGIKGVASLNSFSVPAKQGSLEKATGVLVEELSSTSSIPISSDERQLKGVSDIPGFILKTEKEVFG